MTRELPTIKAYRIVPVYAYPFKEYRYNGSQPLSAEPKKTRPSSPPCTAEGCDAMSRAVGLCEHHYGVYRYAVRKDPSKRIVRPKSFQDDACGTSRGYERHQYWNVPLCDPCIDANTKYRRELKAKRKAKKETGA